MHFKFCFSGAWQQLFFKKQAQLCSKSFAEHQLTQTKRFARPLGFSSPTPSIESVHLVLAMAATRKMLVRALDVSHAFMHSPLGTGVYVALKMLLSLAFHQVKRPTICLKRH